MQTLWRYVGHAWKFLALAFFLLSEASVRPCPGMFLLDAGPATKGMTMSHSVTIRTQTMTTSSTVAINTSYLRTWSGIFKVLELALGVVCVAIAAIHMPTYYVTTPHLFFLLMTTTFLIGTAILLMSCLASFSTSSIIAKTTYEILYHSAAFALYLAASLTFIIPVSDMKGSQQYNVLMAAAVCGLVNAVLYFLSTLIALRAYRGL